MGCQSSAACDGGAGPIRLRPNNGTGGTPCHVDLGALRPCPSAGGNMG